MHLQLEKWIPYVRLTIRGRWKTRSGSCYHRTLGRPQGSCPHRLSQSPQRFLLHLFFSLNLYRSSVPWIVEWLTLFHPGGSAVKNLPAMQEKQEIWVQSLGQEDPLEKGMAIHSSILSWRIPWTEEPGELQSMELQRVRHDWTTKTYTGKLFNCCSRGKHCLY